jgi:aryl-phospho-beta-D-glucosidase BglC (GH1 family)
MRVVKGNYPVPINGGDSKEPNTVLNPYEAIYVRDTLSSEVYKLISAHGVLTAQNVNYNSKVLLKIIATKKKILYNMDEKILIDDVVVTAIYSDNTREVITDWTSNINDLTTFTDGLRILCIEYTVENVTKTTSIYINVALSVSCNATQYASVINTSDVLITGKEIVKSRAKLFNRDKLNMRMRIKITISRNLNTGYTSIGFGGYEAWSTAAIKKIVLNPSQVGEFIIEENFEILYPTANAPADTTLLKLYNSSNLTEGTFEILGMSIALIEPAKVIPTSITASKTKIRYFTSDVINVDDIVATVNYSNDTKATITSFTTNVSSLDLSTSGVKSLIVSYTENGSTVTTPISLTVYKADYTEPQAFNTITAQQMYDNFTLGCNLGNGLDSKGATTRVFGEDAYLNQETAWGQPLITPELLDLVKAQGFNTIRIPVTWFYNSYLDANGNRRIGKFWLARVREVVDYALDRGFYVLLNSHHDMAMFYAGVGSVTFATVLKDANTVWKDIAEKFKHYGEKLILEGYNEIDNLEASWQFGAKAADQMNQLNQVFVDTVRASGSNNVNRILCVPTLIDATSSDTYNAFILPKDVVEGKIMIQVHSYPKMFLQNIEPLFKAMEVFAQTIKAPVLVGEFGTTQVTYTDQAIRAIHASNFVARAKSHHIKCIWWDNGTTKASTSDYALIDRFTNTIKYPAVVSALFKGYNQNIAYRIPDEYVYLVASIDEGDYLTLNRETGTVSNTYWGTFATSYRPVVAGNTLTASVTVSGAAATSKIALANIVFYDKDYNYIKGMAADYQVFSYTTIVPEDACYVRASVNSPHSNVAKDKFAGYLTSGLVLFSIENYSMSSITPIDLSLTQ